MDKALVFLILGTGYGALVAGTGVGVVLSYRGSGVINLAVGAIAMFDGYCFWTLRTGYFGHTFSSGPAIALTILFSLIFSVVFELVFIRPFRATSPLAKLVASLGFLISAPALVTIIFGASAQSTPALLTNEIVHLSGLPILVNRPIIAGVFTVVAVLLVVLYRWTRFGIGTRAAAENERNAVLWGLSPNLLSLSNTVLMGVVASIVGILASTVMVLDPTDLPLLIVPALAAALFGGMTSVGVTFVAGMTIGAAEALLIYVSTLSWFPTDGGPGAPVPGIQELLTFLILLVAVYFRAAKIPGRGEVMERRLPPVPTPRAPIRNAGGYGVLAAIAMFVFPHVFRAALIVSLEDALLFLSIVVITGFVGQVSVFQLALGGVAGFTVAEFGLKYGLGFPIAPIAGVIAAALVGFLTGLPALRIRGVSLVVVTLAAAVAIQNFVFSAPQVARSGGYIVPPTLFGLNLGTSAPLAGLGGAFPSPVFGWLVLVCLIVAALFTCNLRRSRLGREMLAVRANERAAAAVGINVRVTKLTAITFAAAIAGLGGVLIAYGIGSVSAGSFDSLTSLSLIAFAYIGGITTVSGAVLAGLLLTGNLLTVALQTWFGIGQSWTTFVAGMLLIGTLIWLPEGIAGVLSHRGGTSAWVARMGLSMRRQRMVVVEARDGVETVAE